MPGLVISMGHRTMWQRLHAGLPHAADVPGRRRIALSPFTVDLPTAKG